MEKKKAEKNTNFKKKSKSEDMESAELIEIHTVTLTALMLSSCKVFHRFIYNFWMICIIMDILGVHLPKVVDSSQSFNVDISHILESCMLNLRENFNQETFSGFTEAALLLQETCDIYGRKVDYLYESVVQLMTLVNTGFTSESTVRNGEAEVLSPRLSAIRRRRSTAVGLSTEDFQFQEDETGNPLVRPKTKKKKRAPIREAAFGRLIRMKKKDNLEHSIFDDEGNAFLFTNIGRKDEFQLNWPANEDFSLGEDILDRGSGIRWSIFNDRVENMPTPEYSDDGAGIHSIVSRSAPSDFPQTDLYTIDDALREDYGGAHEFHEAAIASTPSIALISAESCSQDGFKLKPILGNSAVEKKIKNSVPAHTRVFELLEPELKACKKDRASKGCQAFLFSNHLKRVLNMSGSLPNFKNKKTDNHLVAEHVKNIMERYNLCNVRRSVSFKKTVKFLREKQDDFLGFDPVVLTDVKSVFKSGHKAVDLNEDVEFQCANANVGVIQTSPGEFRPETPATSDCGNDQEDEVLRLMKEYQKNKEIHVPDRKEVVHWQADMEVRLREMGNQRPFDVHEYGSDIIDCFDHVSDSKYFANLAGGLCSSEVCRYFTSTLMLANTENVCLEADNSSSDCLKLTLFSRTRHHELEEFLLGGVSSVTSTQEPLEPRNDSCQKKQVRSSKKNQSHENRKRPNSRASDILLTCGISSFDVIEAGPSGSHLASPNCSVSPFSDGPCLPASLMKRSCADVDSESSESLSENSFKKKRLQKHQPGMGPWVNKSKKGKGS